MFLEIYSALGEFQWINVFFVILHLTVPVLGAPTASTSIPGMKGIVFFAVQVHMDPARVALMGNTSTGAAATNAFIADHPHSVHATAVRTEKHEK